MPGQPAILQLDRVNRRFDSAGAVEPVLVLRRVSLTLAPSEAVAIVGPSGSGKSTLLNIMGTLDRPTGGTVKLDGQDLGQLTEVQLAEVRNRKIGFVFQAHHLLPQCTVWENVLLPTLAAKDRALRANAVTRAKRLLERVGLGPRLAHRPGQLSGGERQRVAVVRALINQPKLLLADEPTGALDRASAQNLGRLLLELNKEEQVTLVIVTHALELAEQMQRVLELKDGVLEDGTEKQETAEGNFF